MICRLRKAFRTPKKMIYNLKDKQGEILIWPESISKRWNFKIESNVRAGNGRGAA